MNIGIILQLVQKKLCEHNLRTTEKRQQIYTKITRTVTIFYCLFHHRKKKKSSMGQTVFKPGVPDCLFSFYVCFHSFKYEKEAIKV